MSVFTTVAAEITAVEAKLRAEIPAEYHHIVDELKALAEKLTGQAEADAADVAHRAEPVIAAAETDAAAVAGEAAAGVEGIADPAKPSA